MPQPVRVILVTDGDPCAQKAVESIGAELGLRCISASGGNPTPISGQEIVALLKTVPYDPVLVMFDDKGRRDKAQGETAMEYVANHPDIKVLGAVAVASNTSGIKGIAADVSISRAGEIVSDGVDKNGKVCARNGNSSIKGDTVDVLNDIDIPVIVGVGDIGKMDHADSLARGAPVTRKAIEEILKRSDIPYGRRS